MTDFCYLFKCIFFTCERCSHQNLFSFVAVNDVFPEQPVLTICFRNEGDPAVVFTLDRNLPIPGFPIANLRSIQYHLQRWESKKCIVHTIQIRIKM